MTFTVLGLLSVLALCFTVASIVSPRVPLWIGVLLLCFIALIAHGPIRIGEGAQCRRRRRRRRLVVPHEYSDQGALGGAVPAPVGARPPDPGCLGRDRLVVVAGDGPTEGEHRARGVAADLLGWIGIGAAA